MRPHLKWLRDKLSAHERPTVHDIVTLTPAERAREELDRRQRVQLVVALASLALLLLGLLVPAPVPLRLAVLVVGALLPPAVGLVVLGQRGR